MAQPTVIWSVSDLFISSGLETYHAKPVAAIPIWLRAQERPRVLHPSLPGCSPLKKGSFGILSGLNDKVNHFYQPDEMGYSWNSCATHCGDFWFNVKTFDSR